MSDDFRVIENALVPVYVTDTGEKVVYGSELHEVLGVKSNYRDWIKNRLNECDAVEKEDYQSFSQNCEKPTGGRPKLEYVIKLDTAKEMAMLERNEKGKQVRRYFIEVEEKYKESRTGEFDYSNLSPELQRVWAIVNAQTKIELEQKRQADKIDKVETTVQNMKEIFTEPIADWKAEINARVREISIKSGIEYRELWSKLYGELEVTAHTNLSRLQQNKIKRMERAGNTKAAIQSETTKLAIIFAKPKHKAIFEHIVKMYAMRYCA
jgi:phage anti-repressor protein|nr:MAG TPA: AntA/AntB antirepressor [Caudoviricetes sp.]